MTVRPLRLRTLNAAKHPAPRGRESGELGAAVPRVRVIGDGLTAARWVHHPLVFWEVDDIEEVHGAPVSRGATPLGEIADGSSPRWARPRSRTATPRPHSVDVPGGPLAVLKAPDRNLIGLTQDAA